MKHGDICTQEREENAEYCKSHCCPGCVELNVFPIQMKLAFACKAHKCAGRLSALNLDALENNDPCEKLQMFPHKYCAQHLCTVCAAADGSTVVLNLPKVRGCQVCVQHKCRCAGCGNARDLSIQSDFCRLHSCKLCIRLRQPARSQSRGSKYCDEHRCRHPHSFCPDNILGADCRFCRKHSCRVCRGGPCIEDTPRNTCKDTNTPNRNHLQL